MVGTVVVGTVVVGEVDSGLVGAETSAVGVVATTVVFGEARGRFEFVELAATPTATPVPTATNNAAPPSQPQKLHLDGYRANSGGRRRTEISLGHGADRPALHSRNTEDNVTINESDDNVMRIDENVMSHRPLPYNTGSFD